jgi:hypothetical protein
MSKSKHSSKHISTSDHDTAEAEDKKTKQAAKEAMSDVAEEMAPENIVVAEPPRNLIIPTIG